MNEPTEHVVQARERIADALAARQGLKRSSAVSLAAKIAVVDDEITAAAREWADTGTMPSFPEIDGRTPADLAARFDPSQVFTALRGLEEIPALVAETIRFGTASPLARARAWESEVAQAAREVAGVSDVVDHPRSPDGRSRPDLTLRFGGRLVVVEAKARPVDSRTYQAIEQVERHVLVFNAAAGLVVVPDVSHALRGEFTGYLAPVALTDLAAFPEVLAELTEDPGRWRRGPVSTRDGTWKRPGSS